MFRNIFDIVNQKDRYKLFNIKENILDLIDKRNIFPYFKLEEDNDNFCVFIYPVGDLKSIADLTSYINFSYYNDLNEVYSSVVDEYTNINDVINEDEILKNNRPELVELYMHNNVILNKSEFNAKIDKIRNNVFVINIDNDNKPFILDYIIGINVLTYNYLVDKIFYDSIICKYNLMIYKRHEDIKLEEITSYRDYLEEELNKIINKDEFRIDVEYYNIKEMDW